MKAASSLSRLRAAGPPRSASSARRAASCLPGRGIRLHTGANPVRVSRSPDGLPRCRLPGRVLRRPGRAFGWSRRPLATSLLLYFFRFLFGARHRSGRVGASSGGGRLRRRRRRGYPASGPAVGGFADATAETLGRRPVAGRRREIGTLVGVALRHVPQERGEAVFVVGAARARLPARQLAECDPDHPVLRRETGELLEREQLVAAHPRGVGEPCGQLVLPPLLKEPRP